MEKKYVRPMVVFHSEQMESVYLASGGSSATDSSTSQENSLKCDSIHMKGVWQAPDYSDWNGVSRGYRQQFGCLGCPAYTWNGCGLLLHYEESGKADSYNTDNGKRKPSWEKKGYGPNDTVSDWAM